MLEKPKYGWSKFEFDKDAVVSYIDFFPFNLVDEFIKSRDEKRSFCLTFDAEGYDWTLLSYDGVDVEYILRKEETPVIKRLDITLNELVMAVLQDLEKEKVLWGVFPACVDDTDENYQKRGAEKIEEIIEECKKRMTFNFTLIS